MKQQITTYLKKQRQDLIDMAIQLQALVDNEDYSTSTAQDKVLEIYYDRIEKMKLWIEYVEKSVEENAFKELRKMPEIGSNEWEAKVREEELDAAFHPIEIKNSWEEWHKEIRKTPIKFITCKEPWQEIVIPKDDIDFTYYTESNAKNIGVQLTHIPTKYVVRSDKYTVPNENYGDCMNKMKWLLWFDEKEKQEGQADEGKNTQPWQKIVIDGANIEFGTYRIRLDSEKELGVTMYHTPTKIEVSCREYNDMTKNYDKCINKLKWLLWQHKQSLSQD